MNRNFQPTLKFAGQVTGGQNGFSTFLREVARGGLFSSHLHREQALMLDPSLSAMLPVAGGAGAATLAPPAPTLRFTLDNTRFPPNPLCLPGGLAHGAIGLLEINAAPPAVALQARNLGTPPGAGQFVAWLISDLRIPANLDPRDLSLLPRFGEANQPGGVFTVDGTPSSVGRTDVPMWNTVAVAVPVGSFLPDAQGIFQGKWPWPHENWALDPIALLGIAPLPGQVTGDLRLPAGMVRDILVDLFLRSASVFPQLPLHQGFPQRLQAVRQAHITRLTPDGNLTPQLVAGHPEVFLRPQDFNRAAITLEAVTGRTSPKLQPNQQACVLVGLAPDAG